jgi:uncharacterized FlaG/YvyC family protein
MEAAMIEEIKAQQIEKSQTTSPYSGEASAGIKVEIGRQEVYPVDSQSKIKSEKKEYTKERFVEEVTKMMVFKVEDSSKNRIIRQVPPEVNLSIAKYIREVVQPEQQVDTKA